MAGVETAVGAVRGDYPECGKGKGEFIELVYWVGGHQECLRSHSDSS